METFEQRLQRYLAGDDLEIFGWLTVYLQNDYLRELRSARECRLYLSVYLLAHSVVQMISENLFALRGRDGTSFFLKRFVDADDGLDRGFSAIADEIHDARNVMAHQGYSSLQHRVEYFDDAIADGWCRRGNTLHINPAIYSSRFEAAIVARRWIREYREKPEGTRLVQKYRYIRQWLRLERTDPIAHAIGALDASSNFADLRTSDARIRAMIYERYRIGRETAR